jgi:hypothetical protein
LLFVAAPIANSATAPPPSDVPFVLTRLGLDLQVDYDTNTIGGIATLEVRNTSDQPRAKIPLLLNRLMTVSKVRDASGADIPFQQGIVIFQDDPARQVDSIVVTPRSPLQSGATLTMVLHYRGILVGYTETGSLYVQDHVSRDFTIIREDAYAFPVLGVPSRAANHAALREPFAFAASVTVPADLVVAMGGVPGQRTQRDKLITWSYSSSEPVPFLNITIAPYEQLERPGAHIFYFPADAAGAKALDQAIGNAIDRYARWFGSLGHDPRLVVMEIPEKFGSQASLSAGILQTADAFRDRSELSQVYHELSHLWNVPDLDRPSPRWNEGLASFLQSRMAAELDGWNQWDARLARFTASLREHCAPPAPCNTVPMADYGHAGLADYSYSVGMLMFYALYQVLGQETFDRAYAGFFQQHRAKGATTADLVSAFRAASPKSDRILQDWLFTARWYSLLSSGKLFSRIVDEYKQQ